MSDVSCKIHKQLIPSWFKDARNNRDDYAAQRAG